MSKVTVIDRQSGREKSMDRRSAEILVRLGRASYLSRDMQSEKPTAEQTKGDGKGGAEDEPTKPAKKAAKKAAKKRAYKRRDMQAED